VLLVNGAYVLGATLFFALVIWGLRVGFRQIEAGMIQRFEARLGDFKIRTVQLLDAGQIKTISRALFTILCTLSYLAVIYFYLEFALSRLPWTRSIAFALIDMVLEPLKIIGSGILDYIDNLIFLVILVLVLRYILSILQVFFRAIRSSRISFSGFEPEWAWPTYRMVRILVLAFGVVVAYPYIPGSSSDAFKGVSLFLGVLFSLGSSSVISNIIAGYTMTYRRAFKVGDRVKIGETIGDVDEIRLLVTHLRSLKNEDVIIPNSTILNAEITNYSTLADEKGLILHTMVGIGYEVPWRQVKSMLLMAAKRTAGILTEPQPFVLQKSLGDFAVNYELNCYCDDAQQTAMLYSTLHENIQDVFNEYGVQIMTPSYMADTPEPKVVTKDNWYAAPAKQSEAPVPPKPADEPV
jgi:small-conductance mechanosensitive channel